MIFFGFVYSDKISRRDSVWNVAPLPARKVRSESITTYVCLNTISLVNAKLGIVPITFTAQIVGRRRTCPCRFQYSKCRRAAGDAFQLRHTTYVRCQYHCRRYKLVTCVGIKMARHSVPQLLHMSGDAHKILQLLRPETTPTQVFCDISRRLECT